MIWGNHWRARALICTVENSLEVLRSLGSPGWKKGDKSGPCERVMMGVAGMATEVGMSSYIPGALWTWEVRWGSNIASWEVGQGRCHLLLEGKQWEARERRPFRAPF